MVVEWVLLRKEMPHTPSCDFVAMTVGFLCVVVWWGDCSWELGWILYTNLNSRFILVVGRCCLGWQCCNSSPGCNPIFPRVHPISCTWSLSLVVMVSPRGCLFPSRLHLRLRFGRTLWCCLFCWVVWYVGWFGWFCCWLSGCCVLYSLVWIAVLWFCVFCVDCVRIWVSCVLIVM